MAKIVTRTINSKSQPKSKNVIWVDTNNNPPIEKHFINGKWIEMGGGGASDYPSLEDKPSINGVELIGDKTSSDLGIYSKPSGGIPKTDLASDVQTSLGKADTALQSFIEQDPVFTASAAYGISSTDISNWNNKAEQIPVINVDTYPTGMDADKIYQYGTLSGDTTFPPLNQPSDTTKSHIHCWTFTTPATAPTITWPVAITGWAGEEAPEIEASKYYEVTVMNGIGTILNN